MNKLAEVTIHNKTMHPTSGCQLLSHSVPIIGKWFPGFHRAGGALKEDNIPGAVRCAHGAGYRGAAIRSCRPRICPGRLPWCLRAPVSFQPGVHVVMTAPGCVSNRIVACLAPARQSCLVGSL